MNYVYILLMALQFLSGITMIAVVLMQESKNEGLTGQIGSSAQSAFKGMGGREEYLNMVTKNLAIVFFVSSILVAYGTNRWNIH
jgi:protein translocase SecG subunit